MAGSVCRGQKVALTLGRSTASTEMSSRVREGQTSCQLGTTLAGRAAPVPAAQRLPDLRRRLGRPSPGWLFPGVLCGGKAESTITNPTAAATQPCQAPSASARGVGPRAEPRGRSTGCARLPSRRISGPRRVLGGRAPTVVSVGGAAGAVGSRRRGQGGGRRWCGGPPAVLLPRAEEALPGKCRPCFHLAAGLARPVST